MKNMKKFFAVLLTIVMALGMMTTSLAANKSANLTGHTYKAYQIFSGTQADDSAELGNIVWGDGIKGAEFLAALMADTTVIKVVDEDEVETEVEFGTYFTDCTDAASVADVIRAWDDDSAQAKAFAQVAYKHIDGEGAEIGDTLEAGYYLVVDTTDLTGVEDGVKNLALLQLTKKGTFDIRNKTDVPEVDKEILDDEATKTNEASIGDTVHYQITGTMPTNLADYEKYYYKFTDTMSKGLTLVTKDANGNDLAHPVTIKIDDVDVTEYFYISISDYDEENGTTIIAAYEDILLFSLLDGVDVTSESTIVVTYDAILNENAVIAGEGNPNDVKLEYSNNPDDSGYGEPTTPPGENPPPTPPGENPPTPKHPTGETPKDEVKTYVTEITISKVAKVDERLNPLTGAEFTLSGNGVNVIVVKEGKFVEAGEGVEATHYLLQDGTYTTTDPVDTDDETNNTADYASEKIYVYEEVITVKGSGKTDTTVVGAVDANGNLTFTGLGAGHYVIKETIVPDGYNKAEDVVFDLTFSVDNEGKVKFASNNSDVFVGTDNKLDTQIQNFKGTVLPETGGVGTKMFYVIGAVLVAAAGVLLITKRRMIAK